MSETVEAAPTETAPPKVEETAASETAGSSEKAAVNLGETNVAQEEKKTEPAAVETKEPENKPSEPPKETNPAQEDINPKATPAEPPQNSAPVLETPAKLDQPADTQAAPATVAAVSEIEQEKKSAEVAANKNEPSQSAPQEAPVNQAAKIEERPRISPLELKPLEKTLAIIRPEAMHHREKILQDITNAGFYIIQRKKIKLSPDIASNLFSNEKTEAAVSMSVGHVEVVLLAKQAAIADFRQLCGPEDPTEAKQLQPNSLSAKYGTDAIRNGIYSTGILEKLNTEIRMFFPDTVVEPIETGIVMRDYLQKNINTTLIQGLTALCKSKPGNPVEWLGQWLIENNPNCPKVHVPE